MTSVQRVDLGPGIAAGFSDRRAGNLSHRRPHLPSRLARARSAVAAELGLTADRLHFMQQVHGADVAQIDDATPLGAEIRDVDALVTAAPARALVVQVADCVPVLIAVADRAVAAVHAGRRGLHDGVVEHALERLEELAGDLADARASIGPAIGGCCYEVEDELRAEVADRHPAAHATTTWGTPSLDLPAAVSAILGDAGVRVVGSPPPCTRCAGDRWFSHRGDPHAGRQAGIVALAEAA